jgi:hypothetical protein
VRNLSESSQLRGLFGDPLTGSSLVRNIYSDEAGTSAGEPNSVVVALIVHPDTQWHALADEFNELMQEYVPDKFREGFVFHAKRLAQRKNYPGWDEGRYAYMRRVMQLPGRFHVPLCMGVVRRGKAVSLGQIEDLRPFEIDHLHAFILAMSWADKFLRQYCGDEMAQVIADEHDLKKVLRAHIKRTRQSPLRLHTKVRGMYEQNTTARIEVNTVQRVVEEVHFAESAASPILQIADACAYGIRRFFAKESYGESYLEEILGKEYCDNSLIKTTEPWDHFSTMRVFDVGSPIY